MKDEVDEGWGVTPRYIMQTVGTKLREVCPRLWIHHVIRFVSSISDSHFVVSDIRFGNELDAIKKIGGEIWLIKRDDAPEIDGKDHVNELELSSMPEEEFDRVIVNKTNELDSTFKVVDAFINIPEE
jgi:hypothetical protein